MANAATVRKLVLRTCRHGGIEKLAIFADNVPEFYSILDFKVSENEVVAFGYATEKQSGIIEIKDSVAREVFWQKDNVLYSKEAEIKTENKFAFHIMSDGRKNYYMATNIDVRGGKSRKIYMIEEI